MWLISPSISMQTPWPVWRGSLPLFKCPILWRLGCCTGPCKQILAAVGLLWSGSDISDDISSVFCADCSVVLLVMTGCLPPALTRSLAHHILYAYSVLPSSRQRPVIPWRGTENFRRLTRFPPMTVRFYTVKSWSKAESRHWQYFVFWYWHPQPMFTSMNN